MRAHAPGRAHRKALMVKAARQPCDTLDREQALVNLPSGSWTLRRAFA
jgi:hypothetical protein